MLSIYMYCTYTLRKLQIIYTSFKQKHLEPIYFIKRQSLKVDLKNLIVHFLIRNTYNTS